MSENHPEIIFVKRRSTHEEEHHGGAWKIAFADFMTAMMTFFLVLWIINATDKSTKSVIARYFNPVRLENPAKGHKGVHTEANINNPSSKDGESGLATAPADAKAEKTKSSASNQQTPPSKTEAKKAGDAPEPLDAAHPKPTLPENALLADPYGSLDRIAGPPPPAGTTPPNAGTASDAAPLPEPAETDTFRDPFDFIESLPRETKAAEAVAESRRAPPSAQPSPASAKSTEQTIRAAQATPSTVPTPSPLSPAQATPAKEKRTSSAAAMILNELRAKIGGTNPGPGPSIDVRATTEGILISLTDQLNFSMFPVGSAEPQRQVVQAMNVIAQSLANYPGAIVIRGHTDARPYRSQTYDNWRLSEARAQMAYYMLTRANLSDRRVEHVEGYADRRLKNAANPYAAENRRIEILLRESER